MADKLMFPIGFNLDDGIRKADNEWKNGKANQLSNLLKKTPVKVGLALDVKDDKALERVKLRLEKLKLEPITPETKKAIQDLAKELETLAKALTKISSLTRGGASSASPDAVRAARINEINARSAAKIATEHERARAAAARAEAAELRLAQARQRSLGGIRSQSSEYVNQLGYIDRLIRRMAVLWSISMVSNFVSKLREVTAEFELQRVSLGAIIQDQSRANQLFSEIKTFALQSPLTIMDLTKYTKQLAAYKIGVDELFDTTKRLADVSVGLGVSFDRIVLAYGQIRAAGVLRASEIRQLTEAGIPIVEALSEKLSEINGKLVSASDVMGMVEKRMISFEQVKEIFEDMTSAGGMFYNMQEKQSQTLFGMWSKLGDAAAVMYDEMGNTESVNAAMKAFIGTLENAFRNWRLLAGVIGSASFAMAQYAIAQKIATAKQNIRDTRAAALAKVAAAQEAYNATLRREAVNLRSLDAAVRNNARAELARAAALRQAAQAELQAAMGMTVLKKALNGIKSFFVGNWVTLLLMGIGTAISYFMDANEKANRLKNTLNDIKLEGAGEETKSVYNFERLAKKAVEAADGSKEQKDALDELHRTYKDMIPVQDMTIEKLRALKGNYEQLTKAVSEYIYQRTLEKEINAITENYGQKINELRKSLTKILGGGAFDLTLDAEQIRAVLDKVVKLSEDTSKTAAQVWVEAFREVTDVSSDMERKITYVIENVNKSFGKLPQVVRVMNEEIASETSLFGEVTGYVGKYREEWKKLQEAMTKAANTNTDDKSFLANQKRANEQILAMAASIGNVFQQAGATWKKEWSDLMMIVNESDPSKISTIDFSAILDSLNEETFPQLHKFVKEVQNAYDGLIPSNDIVKGVNVVFHEVAKATGTNIDLVQGYLMKGNDNYEKYRKNLKETLDGIKKDIIAVNVALQGVGVLNPEEIERLNAEKERLAELEKFFEALLGKLTDTKQSSSRTGSDTRLQTLNEIEKSLTEINKKYDELSKKEGATKALEHTNELYDKQLKYLNQIANRFGLQFKMPTDFSDLQKYREQILKVIEKLKASGLKGAEKAAIDLGMTISTGNIDKLQKSVEQQLKELQDRVSRTKTAKDFYDRILNLTGDYEMSAEITMSVYGDTGESLQKEMAKELEAIFGSYTAEVPVEIITDGKIDYSELDAYIKKADELQERLNKTTDENERKELQAQIVPEKQLSELKKVNDDYKKSSAEQWQLWLKDLEKAKDYADKRVDIERRTAQKIAEIQASDATDEQKRKLTAGYNEKATQELAKLEYEAFKETPLYVQMFDDLEHASTRTLETMREKLLALRDTWGASLDPTQLKEMQSRLNDIEGQLRERNPFKVLKDALIDYQNTAKSFTISGALANLGKAEVDYYNTAKDKGADSREAQEAKKTLEIEKRRVEIAKQLVDENGKELKGKKAIEKATQIAYSKEVEAKKALDDAEAEYQRLRESGASEAEVKDAYEKVEAKKEELRLAQETTKVIEKSASVSQKLKKALLGAANSVIDGLQTASTIASAVASLSETFGASKEDVQYWNDVADALDRCTKGVQDIVQSAMSGNVMGVINGAIMAIPNLIGGISDLFHAGKVRKANKEIKRQQEILDELAYTYQRLQKAQESALGNQYISNYNQRLKNLQAQATAYQKQADAERSKGKKADEEKAKQFEEQARSAADEIKDMQQELQNYFAGTDITSAARDFARAWLDAKVSFEDTTEAMREKFADLIQNMIIEAMAAEVMKRALEPFYKALDNAVSDDTFDIDEVVKAAEIAYNSIGNANDAMEVMFNTLEAKGLDMQKIFGEADTQMTGISRDIATASEESINGLAQGITTQNFYISGMYGYLGTIVQIMQGGYTPAITADAITLTDLVTMQNQHLANLPQIAANTAAMVDECRRAANTCENIATQLSRVIKPKGTSASFVVSTAYA